MPRTKTVSLDGATFLIAPLSLAQVDEYIKPPEGPDEVTAYKHRSYQLICWSLNNAGKALVDYDQGFKPWDEERVRQEMDLLLLQFLTQEILSFSGLKLETASTPPRPGESQAALEAAAIN